MNAKQGNAELTSARPAGAADSWQEYFKGKKVTLMGLGLLGRGIGDARFLAERGVKLTVTDLKSKEALGPSLQALQDLPGITFVLGEHRLEDFRERDFILKAAGVPADSPYIAEARRQGIPIEMSTALFAALTPATVVGVTGTRGKSTITHLLAEIIRKHAAGDSFQEISPDALQKSSRKIFLGGNIRGLSTLALLSETKAGDSAVLELDSWQLQGFAERGISPQVSVFSTFLADHLNYYKGDMRAYFADKAAIFLNQKADDVLVVGEQVVANPYFQEYRAAGKIAARLIVAGAETIPADWPSPLLGRHNRYNIGIAVAAARACGIPDSVSQSVVETFTGVPGRLELVAAVDGISFYNDTTSTTPDATLAGLAALAPAKIVLIMGGADKHLDMSTLLSELPKAAKALVLLPGSGTERLKSDILSLKLPTAEAPTMAEAVATARALAAPGETILLSPALASFGAFSNEFDRGDQFTKAVLKLESSPSQSHD